MPLEAFSSRAFQAFDYMPHGAGGRRKLPWIDLDQSRHVFVQTAFQLAHARGEWRYAKWQLRALQPAPDVASKLLADGSILCVLRLDAGEGPATHPGRPYAKSVSAAGWSSRGGWRPKVNFVKRDS